MFGKSNASWTMIRRKKLILVKWKNWPHNRNTWEPKKTLEEDLDDLFTELWNEMQEEQGTKVVEKNSPDLSAKDSRDSETINSAGSRSSARKKSTQESPKKQGTSSATKPKDKPTPSMPAAKAKEDTQEESGSQVETGGSNDEEEDAWEVERFVHYNEKSGKIQVKWKDWGQKWNTWEPKKTLKEDLGEVFDALWEEMKSKGKKKSTTTTPNKQKSTPVSKASTPKQQKTTPTKQKSNPVSKASTPQQKKNEPPTWEVERFVAFDSKGQKILVKWKDCPPRKNTWEPVEALKTDLGDLYDELWGDLVQTLS
eukprot:gb/GECG01001513.1/.p1 GENE.gb/GECG01001513.1/~~gb/GECG01001513.1/.p1  ORF type:complete len:311 (+),score=61.23 gb/GECG01001513.1/:1-933(+)